MMEEKIVIDKTTYKIMKYLYKHGETLYSTISKKFGEDNATAINSLCQFQYAAHRKEDKSLSYDTSTIYEKSRFGLTPKGNKFVEDRQESKVVTFTPIFLSIVSICVSIISLIISITSRNPEIFVHLLE